MNHASCLCGISLGAFLASQRTRQQEAARLPVDTRVKHATQERATGVQASEENA